MQTSYKEYLLHLEKKAKPSLLIKGAVIAIFIASLTLGGVSSFIFWQYQKQPHISNEAQFVQTASHGFNTAKVSLEEVLLSFKVAGEKIDIINAQEEASGSAVGFYATLDDLTAAIAKIESARKTIEFQKELLSLTVPPEKFSKIESDLNSYYEISQELLSGIAAELKRALEITLVSGSGSYLPALTDQSIWQTTKEDEVSKYFEDSKNQAATVAAKLSKLEVESGFQERKNDQITYLEEFIITAQGIVNILQTEKPPESESSKVEKAYELFVQFERTNKLLSQKILDEKSAPYNLKQNLSKFAHALTIQNSIENQMRDLFGGFTK